MTLRRKLLNIFFISILIPVSLFGQIAFLSFKDKSSYKGSWNLSYDIPDFISDYLREKYRINVLSPYSTENLIKEENQLGMSEILLSKNYEYLISGTITDFSINRMMAGEPKVAQYETYSNKIEIEIEITNLKLNRIILSERFEQKSSELGVGVTIFGRETETKKEFEILDRMKFGSEDFLRTLIGKNLIKFCEKFSSKLETVINLQPNDLTEKTQPTDSKSKLKRKILSGEILFVDEETKEVFINLGKKDNLYAGMLLPVYAALDTIYDNSTGELIGITDKKIGDIEIIEVRGERFSLGIIKEEKEKISKGNKIRKIEISPE